eukprot:scaffold52223_cov30-Tisochrysis_lutea.AAC.2
MHGPPYSRSGPASRRSRWTKPGWSDANLVSKMLATEVRDGQTMKRPVSGRGWEWINTILHTARARVMRDPARPVLIFERFTYFGPVPLAANEEIFVSKDAIHILKHHGSYMQQNRDLKKKADRDQSYQFMLRLKVRLRAATKLTRLSRCPPKRSRLLGPPASL